MATDNIGLPTASKFAQRLLNNLILQVAFTFSALDAANIAEEQWKRVRYILNLLNASVEIRRAVMRDAQASDSEGQHQLAANLHMFDLLSDSKKADFKKSLKTNAALAIAGIRAFARRTVYPPESAPPHHGGHLDP